MRDFVENHEAHQDKRLLTRLLGYLKPYTKKFILAFFLMIITTFTSMILPLASGLAIDLMKDTTITLSTKLWTVGIGTGVILMITGFAIIVNFYTSIMLQNICSK